MVVRNTPQSSNHPASQVRDSSQQSSDMVERLREALDPAEAAVNRLSPDFLGQKVRVAWVKWAERQPDPKPSWLVPYRDLSEPDKQADRDIGIALARIGAGAFASEHRFLFSRIIAALEASHHAELVETLQRCRRFFVSRWSAAEAEACLNELDALLAKIGGKHAKTSETAALTDENSDAASLSRENQIGGDA